MTYALALYLVGAIARSLLHFGLHLYNLRKSYVMVISRIYIKLTHGKT
ncbi:MAG: hypothetical protein F6J93_01035 [Oscillatoria sp. SIO1A7]|nr:hypothetical protein [Oscillatoria sp. SIO1A7]